MAESNNYIKLPNQGNIASNMRLLYELKNSCDYSDANGYFSKSDIAEIAANALLVTTGSKLGSDVLQTIHNKTISEGDNSPLQNTKMRMQLLRILGLVAADYNSEIYAITELGELMASTQITGQQKKALLRELFMSISSSSESYDFTCPEGFHCYLGLQICYALASLDYKIGVDEMPIITTYDYREIQSFVNDASAYRSQGIVFPKTHVHYPKTQSGQPLAQSKNLTRSINQILRYCNIVKPKLERIGKQNYYVCTDEGKVYVDKIKSLWSSGKIVFKRPFEFRKLNILDQRNLCKQGYDNILIRAGITTGKDTGIYFSPFQMLPEVNVSWLLGRDIRKHPEKSDTKVQAINSSLTTRDLRLKAIYKETEDNYIAELAAHEELVQEILKCQTHEDKMAFVQKQIEQHRNDDKYTFYPYIHSLLKIIGLDCKGEIGRYDAYSEYKGHIIPMEIKSGTEDISYNQKGLRQAIENKICCYNSTLPDDMEYSTLLLGYAHPSNDMDIKKLIDAANETLRIKIIAMDLSALLIMCVKVVCDNMQLDIDSMLKSHGLILEEL